MIDRIRLRLSALYLGFSTLALGGLAFFAAPGWLLALTGLCLVIFSALQSSEPAPSQDNRSPARPEQTGMDYDLAGKLTEALPDPCLLLDKRGAVVVFNSKAAGLIAGLRKNSQLSFYLRWPALNEAIACAMNGEVSRVDIEERVPIERWYSFFLNPIGNGHVCVTIHDRTEQQRAERMRVDFVANASHELRTPLASLLGFVETLQGAARNDEKSREHFLNIMQLQAKRMSRLIDDLLSLSRIEMHLHIQPETQLELASLLQSTLDSLRPLAAERGVTLVLHPSQERFTIRGDRDELFRAFENLIENAIKYGESGKKVEIEIRPSRNNSSGNMIGISIRDFGPGIAEDHIPRLTERFYRVDEAASREKGGTGLGLAIVKHILNRHRGMLEIESKLGEGSVFTAFLPEVRPAETAAPS